VIDLSGKTALVTGGSRGIGRACCELLARAHARLVVNYRVERLGLSQGLGSEIPGDASMVFVVGPREPFLPAELASSATASSRCDPSGCRSSSR